ncbi:hypothetical protein DERF_003286 [Dermatophagoides farinae]|uniref:Uncharacterized protein n=1 Tax=Dermatophagoides farinae TaxID=6954 RepID=A0A922IDY9_DERFA|nr:hypothetical protein DERF_003286 [Dermatophagoides farinae]
MDNNNHSRHEDPLAPVHFFSNKEKNVKEKGKLHETTIITLLLSMNMNQEFLDYSNNNESILDIHILISYHYLHNL